MGDLFLAMPSKEYQQSFENYVLSYKKANDDFYFHLYEKALSNFDGYINDLDAHSKGINVPRDWVTTSTFWLIDAHEVVGVARVRHREVECAGHIGYDISPCCRNKGYGTQILKLALEEAVKVGIKEAIVTCSTDNISSKKIIEKNNGELLGIIFDEKENENLYKYRIVLSNDK